MQQFTVPQFIDVENKIIGPLTVRQFLIILSAAIIAGIAYRLFDFSLFLTITIILGIIAITFSFVKINGRPFHFFILNILQTFRRPHTRIWNKVPAPEQEIKTESISKNNDQPAPKELYQKSRLSELSLIVDTKGRYKGEWGLDIAYIYVKE